MSATGRYYYCSDCCSFQIFSGVRGARLAGADPSLEGIVRRQQQKRVAPPHQQGIVKAPVLLSADIKNGAYVVAHPHAMWKVSGYSFSYRSEVHRKKTNRRRNSFLEGGSVPQTGTSLLLAWSHSNVRGHTIVGACLEEVNDISTVFGMEEHKGTVFKATEAFGEVEKAFMLRAVKWAERPVGLTAPHPLSGCVVVNGEGQVVGEAFLYAQGTPSAEVQALEMAGENARGSTVYINLEPGDCHGDVKAVQALVEAGVARVVVGMRHPLQHSKGQAIADLRKAGVLVDVLGEDLVSSYAQEARRTCLLTNEALLFRAAYRLPFSVLKYAMTLDGKIACSTGHAAWVTSKEARKGVFDLRARSDAIVVGGNTVRRDNPRLTTRREGGHLPVRIVMSRTLRLPQDANLWDVSSAPTIVMTQRGTREEFQAELARRGVEIVQFDFLTPKAVMDYCYQRGFLQILWECGGTLSAPALTGGVIHKVMAFVAPKIIGGTEAPTPVGDLGFVEMTQAVNLSDVTFRQVGPDMQIDGYLQPFPLPQPAAASAARSHNGSSTAGNASCAPGDQPPVIKFYKTWDEFGALSNFTSHPILASDEGEGNEYTWRSVEHFYQAQKFSGVADPEAKAAVEAIKSAASPEEAARIGRRLALRRPDLLRPDWDAFKVPVMYSALRKKFSQHPHLADLLLSTGQALLVESSPHDTFWGSGRANVGANHLGRLLMRLRTEIRNGRESAESQEHPTLEAGSSV